MLFISRLFNDHPQQISYRCALFIIRDYHEMTKAEIAYTLSSPPEFPDHADEARQVLFDSGLQAQGELISVGDSLTELHG